jgi:hypothetical protein
MRRLLIWLSQWIDAHRWPEGTWSQRVKVLQEPPRYRYTERGVD